MSRDPAGYSGSDRNLSESVASQPTTRTDPSGRGSVPPGPKLCNPTGIAIGIGIGAGQVGYCYITKPLLEPTLSYGASEALEQTCKIRCKHRHPLWPECPSWINDDTTSDALGGLPKIDGMNGPYKTQPCKYSGPARLGPRCKGGGKRYNCPVVYVDEFGIVHRRTAGVFCCNCCRAIRTGIYCYLRTPPWANKQQDPAPGINERQLPSQSRAL